MQPIFRQETTAGSSTAQQLTEDDISRDTQMQVGGPFEIKFDIGRLRRWTLLTGPYFFTYPHYDASGLATFMVVTTGMKIWSYLQPTVLEGPCEDVSRHFLKIAAAASAHLYSTAPDRLPSLALAHNIFLTPGTLL